MTRASEQPRHKHSILPLVVAVVCVLVELVVLVLLVLS